MDKTGGLEAGEDRVDMREGRSVKKVGGTNMWLQL